MTFTAFLLILSSAFLHASWNLMSKARRPSLASVFSSSAYGMILLAMPMVTNVSLVQAFRQISLPICAVAGVIAA